MARVTQWRWHLDEVFAQNNGQTQHLWPTVDHEGEVLESFVIKTNDKASALNCLRNATMRYGCLKVVTTNRLHAYGAAMREIDSADRQLQRLPERHPRGAV